MNELLGFEFYGEPFLDQPNFDLVFKFDNILDQMLEDAMRNDPIVGEFCYQYAINRIERYSDDVKWWVKVSFVRLNSIQVVDIIK